MKKKLVMLIMIVLLMFSFTSCGAEPKTVEFEDLSFEIPNNWISEELDDGGISCFSEYGEEGDLYINIIAKDEISPSNLNEAVDSLVERIDAYSPSKEQVTIDDTVTTSLYSFLDEEDNFIEAIYFVENDNMYIITFGDGNNESEPFLKDFAKTIKFN